MVMMIQELTLSTAFGRESEVEMQNEFHDERSQRACSGKKIEQVQHHDEA
jgi:hypothetical protein